MFTKPNVKFLHKCRRESEPLRLVSKNVTAKILYLVKLTVTFNYIIVLGC